LILYKNPKDGLYYFDYIRATAELLALLVIQDWAHLVVLVVLELKVNPEKTDDLACQVQQVREQPYYNFHSHLVG
jgi:hypothetical protein